MSLINVIGKLMPLSVIAYMGAGLAKIINYY